MNEAERREQTKTEPITQSVSERFIVSDLQTYLKSGQPLAQLTVVSQGTGETCQYWLKDSLAIQAKNLLKKNDTIEAVPSEISGSKGPVNTFLSFQRIGFGEEEGLICN